MQKKLIALAIAGLSGAAFAQSNVTIYGVADVTFDNVRATGASDALVTTPGHFDMTTGAFVAPTTALVSGDQLNFKSRNRVTSNSSYIGFKGVEDLGNGLKAVFQIENGVSLENGAAGSWNNRDSFVGVAGAFGTVVAGNVTGPTRALGNALDVNAGATGIGANTALLGKIGGGAGASAFDQRIGNAVAYISPNFSGFTGVVGYSTGVNVGGVAGAANRENAPAGDTATGTVGYTLGANYANGPIYVGYAYTQVDLKLAADQTAKLKDNRVGGYYKFGSVGQVGLLFDQPKFSDGAGYSEKNNIWYVSGKFNVTPAGAIIGQYGWAGKVKTSNGTLDQTGARHFELGYEHALSKRTVLKAVYSQVNNKDNSNFDYLYGVSNANSSATTDGMSAGTNIRGFSFGVRHSF